MYGLESRPYNPTATHTSSQRSRLAPFSRSNSTNLMWPRSQAYNSAFHPSYNNIRIRNYNHFVPLGTGQTYYTRPTCVKVRDFWLRALLSLVIHSLITCYQPCQIDQDLHPHQSGHKLENHLQSEPGSKVWIPDFPLCGVHLACQ